MVLFDQDSRYWAMLTHDVRGLMLLACDHGPLELVGAFTGVDVDLMQFDLVACGRWSFGPPGHAGVGFGHTWECFVAGPL